MSWTSCHREWNQHS